MKHKPLTDIERTIIAELRRRAPLGMTEQEICEWLGRPVGDGDVARAMYGLRHCDLIVRKTKDGQNRTVWKARWRFFRIRAKEGNGMSGTEGKYGKGRESVMSDTMRFCMIRNSNIEPDHAEMDVVVNPLVKGKVSIVTMTDGTVDALDTAIWCLDTVKVVSKCLTPGQLRVFEEYCIREGFYEPERTRPACVSTRIVRAEDLGHPQGAEGLQTAGMGPFGGRA